MPSPKKTPAEALWVAWGSAVAVTAMSSVFITRLLVFLSSMPTALRSTEMVPLALAPPPRSAEAPPSDFAVARTAATINPHDRGIAARAEGPWMVAHPARFPPG